ncbi:MAG: hypothetical protein WAM78_06815 [Candidatus Sulfotelmatobacter sp.]
MADIISTLLSSRCLWDGLMIPAIGREAGVGARSTTSYVPPLAHA